MKVLLLSVDLKEVWKHVNGRAEWAALANNIADGALLHWSELSRQTMSPSTANEYRRGLSRVNVGTSAAVILGGVFPLMVERGWRVGGVDLRETMLIDGQRGVKTSKDGHKYRRVSFRHAAPGSGQTNNGIQPPGSAEGRFGAPPAQQANINRAVSAAMRKLKPWHPGARGPSATTGDMTPKVGKLRSFHTTSIYSGMRRAGGGAGYRTFRTISNNPNSVRVGASYTTPNWWHPGIQPRNLAPKVRAWIGATAPALIAALRARLR